MSAERVTELISPIARSEVEFLAPCHRRHPRDGVLVTQLVRPLVRALYGVALDEPLGAEFSCSGRFASHCLERDIWEHEVARFAHRPAAAHRGRRPGVCHSVRYGGPHPPSPARAPRSVKRFSRSFLAVDRESSCTCLVLDGVQRYRALAHVGDSTPGRHPMRKRGTTRAWPDKRGTTSVKSIRCSRRCWTRDCSRASSRKSRLSELRSDDELWVKTVYAFAAAARRGTVQHRAPGRHCSFRCTCGVPRHSWHTPRTRQTRWCSEGLESLSQTFLRLKPVLVDSWSAEV